MAIGKTLTPEEREALKSMKAEVWDISKAIDDAQRRVAALNQKIRTMEE